MRNSGQPPNSVYITYSNFCNIRVCPFFEIHYCKNNAVYTGVKQVILKMSIPEVLLVDEQLIMTPHFLKRCINRTNIDTTNCMQSTLYNVPDTLLVFILFSFLHSIEILKNQPVTVIIRRYSNTLSISNKAKFSTC